MNDYSSLFLLLPALSMSPIILFSFVLVYFIVLLIVAYYTSRNSNNDTFFIGNKSSNWLLVAFGMIGTSLSGVTFVSVPGTVGITGFAYFQVVIGYLIGYFVVALVLLPLYYRLNLTSIYNYLLQRFGLISYRTGALFFILSRTLGATARLYLVINVLQIFILDEMGIPFWVTTLIILLMILLYTFRGGVKTIVWTDTLQTTFMLLGLVVCVIFLMNLMHLSFSDTLNALKDKGYTRIFNTDVNSPATFKITVMIDLLSMILKPITHIINTTAKVICTIFLKRILAASVIVLFLLRPIISIQKDEVNAVIAPSALGKSAEIRPIIKMIEMNCGKC